MYAVGVGVVPEETLLSIGGDPANVFDVSDFTELDSEYAMAACLLFLSMIVGRTQTVALSGHCIYLVADCLMHDACTSVGQQPTSGLRAFAWSFDRIHKYNSVGTSTNELAASF